MPVNEVSYLNRRAVRLEDDRLRVTLSVEGGHIAELLEKRSGINPLWTPPWPSIEPSAYSPQRNPEYGSDWESKLLSGILGHNLALDIFGPPSPEEYAAGITVHGEASVVPYTFEGEGNRLVARAHLPIAMLDFERTLELADDGVLRIRERVTNLTGLDRPIAWTQHVTLGPPFVEPGVTHLHIPGKRSAVYPHDLSKDDQKYLPKAEFEWPNVPNKDGSSTDLSIYPSSKRSAGVTGHLVDGDRETGFFLSWHPQTRVLVGYAWRRADFPWISIWEENRSRTGAPWNGETITRGLEFGVSPFAEGRRAMMERGSLFNTLVYRWLPAHATATVDYVAFAFQSDRLPQELPAQIHFNR